MVIHSYQLKKKKLEAAFDPQASERPNNGTKNKKACARAHQRTNEYTENEWLHEWTNERTKAHKNERAHERTNELAYECTNERANKQGDQRTHEKGASTRVKHRKNEGANARKKPSKCMSTSRYKRTNEDMHEWWRSGWRRARTNKCAHWCKSSASTHSTWVVTVPRHVLSFSVFLAMNVFHDGHADPGI